MNMEQVSPMINLPTAAADDGEIRMLSRELAELCGKDHRHVLRDIRKMLEQLDLPEGGYAQNWTHPQNGQTYEGFSLPKDLTLTLVAGYNVVLRKRIIDRWLELEGQAAPSAIDVRNPQQLALIASQLIEVNQEQAKQIEAMQETVQAHDKLIGAEGSLCITDAAKTLGIRRRDLFEWMGNNGWIFRRGEGEDWIAYAPRLTSGVMEHRVTTFTRPDGTEKVVTQARVTPKGLSTLAKLIFPTVTLIEGGAA